MPAWVQVWWTGTVSPAAGVPAAGGNVLGSPDVSAPVG